MEGVQDRLSTTESAEASGGYDGPGPCGVLPPHHARLGGQSCLLANTAGRVHSTPSTQATPEHAQTGIARVSDSPAQPAVHAHGASNCPRLSITVTLPACRTTIEGRGPPFPVIIFINGFQVGFDFHRGCTLNAGAREAPLDSTVTIRPQANLTEMADARSCAPVSTPNTRGAWRAGATPSSSTTRACSASLTTARRWMSTQAISEPITCTARSATQACTCPVKQEHSGQNSRRAQLRFHFRSAS